MQDGGPPAEASKIFSTEVEVQILEFKNTSLEVEASTQAF